MQKIEILSLLLFFFAEFSRNNVFGRSMVMIASLNTVRVCVHITMRIGMHDLFCERPFETRLFPWAKSMINSGGRGMTKKIKVAVEGIKLTTGFWRYRPKRLLFELASRKSRTLGVDQNFLIFWRPRLPFHGKSYEQMDGLGVTPILGNLHIYIYIYIYIYGGCSKLWYPKTPLRRAYANLSRPFGPQQNRDMRLWSGFRLLIRL